MYYYCYLAIFNGKYVLLFVGAAIFNGKYVLLFFSLVFFFNVKYVLLYAYRATGESLHVLHFLFSGSFPASRAYYGMVPDRLWRSLSGMVDYLIFIF